MPLRADLVVSIHTEPATFTLLRDVVKIGTPDRGIGDNEQPIWLETTPRKILNSALHDGEANRGRSVFCDL